MAETVLKVSVLAGGDLLVDGRPATIADVASALERAAAEKIAVWYYRENGAGAPPPVALELMKLIVANKLPVRMSSKSDFSDSIQPATKSDQIFQAVRAKASQRHVAIVRPDGKYLVMPAMARESAKPEHLAMVERILPSQAPRNVAVIGETEWTMGGALNTQAANAAIPFFGMLMGFACIGHAIWIFDGSAPLLAAGCREADILIVDSVKVDSLPEGWRDTAARAMRGNQILVHDRATYKLRKV